MYTFWTILTRLIILNMIISFQPFNSQIKFAILLTVNHNKSYNISSENLVLDQLIIPKLISFFILNTYLVEILLKL